MKDLSEYDNLTKFADKEYRDEFMQAQIRTGIAYQIQALRRKFDLTQTEMAQKTGKTQSVIARLSNTEYGKVSVQTLLDIASGLDVALLVKFVSYPDFLAQTDDMSDKALQPDTVQQSIEKAASKYLVQLTQPHHAWSVRLAGKDHTQSSLQKPVFLAGRSPVNRASATTNRSRHLEMQNNASRGAAVATVIN